MVRRHPKLQHLADNFVPLDEEADVCLLIGRDAGDVLATATTCTATPFAHKTSLGWAVVGAICPFNNENKPLANVLRTSINHEHYITRKDFSRIRKNPFQTFFDDEEQGLSSNDKKFVDVIENNIRVNSEGHLETPLPLRDVNVVFPDNKMAVLNRQRGTLKQIAKQSEKFLNCLQFMQNMIDSGHVEQVPIDEINRSDGKVWYLPIFPVQHPKKKKWRLVFDSAAKYGDVSLNSALLQGPDYTNRLRGVLLRFRENLVGFASDIEGMFHSFHVSPDERDMMRFFWHEGNDPNKKIVTYRARVHIFGNTSSPAVSTLCLRKAADMFEQKMPTESVKRATTFIYRDFYVDDGLSSAANAEEAIDILKTAKQALSSCNINLHKIVSSDSAVLNAFPCHERGIDIKEIDFEPSSAHKTLGVAWNVAADSFQLNVTIPERPYTRRGVLAVINSIYDPTGMASPVILGGRLFQRTILTLKKESGNPSSIDWDQILPLDQKHQWDEWKNSLRKLSDLNIPRSVIPNGFGEISDSSLHMFCDASDVAIGHVCYLRLSNSKHDVHVSFINGDSKVAPRAATSTPRLELCAAVDAVYSTQQIVKELVRKPSSIYYYTDSKVLLAYLQNKEKRFSKYVTRRIELILAVTDICQWHHIKSSDNPADLASRPTSADQLLASCWLSGPPTLWHPDLQPDVAHSGDFDIYESLPEECQQKTTLTTRSSYDDLTSKLLEKHNCWNKVVNITKRLLGAVSSWLDRARQRLGYKLAPRDQQGCTLHAMNLILRDAQYSSYKELMPNLKAGSSVPMGHSLARLSPIISDDGLIRVGGRLKFAEVPFIVKHPIVLPHCSIVSTMIALHYHRRSGHQGLHVTLGAINNAGYYIEKSKSLIKRLIKSCVTCRKLRAKVESQLMSDLPGDRLEQVAPFTNTGLDVMGPWHVATGLTTRKSKGSTKVWAVLFTCLSSRAVHIEALPSLDTSSFINAIRRFQATRGSCKLIRSDRGTNFIGAVNENIDFQTLSESMEKNFQWIFNPPHASHFGGAWERKIGLVKRALDYALMKTCGRLLTFDELSTLLQEAAFIVNSTPLWQVSDDPNDPQPLSPIMLLTLREPTEAIQCFSDDDISAYGKRRWRRIQGLADSFWKQWRNSYMHTLNMRKKWLNKSPNLKIGDLVLLREKNCKRNCWPLAIIEQVKTSSDGVVRSVVLRVSRTVNGKLKVTNYERPISELIFLMRE